MNRLEAFRFNVRRSCGGASGMRTIVGADASGIFKVASPVSEWAVREH
jgi:hypothetical protein